MKLQWLIWLAPLAFGIDQSASAQNMTELGAGLGFGGGLGASASSAYSKMNKDSNSNLNSNRTLTPAQAQQVTAVSRQMIKAGEAKRKAGDFAAAALLYRRAAENRQQYFGKYDATALDAYRTAGSLQTMAKDYAGAEKSYRAALAISSLNHGLGSFESIPTLTSLAGSLKMQNRTGEAIGILRQVLVLQERQAGLDSDLAAATRSEVADMCLKVGDYNNGEALFKQTAEIAESKGQTDKCITALQSYANVLQQTLKLKEAEQVMQKINAIKGSASSPEATTKLSPTNDPNSAVRSNQNTAPSRQMRSSLPENPNAVQTTSVTSGAGYASSAATASSSK